MLKVGVTGSKGRLGDILVRMGAIPLDADILDGPQLKRELERVRPEIVVHTAAFTDVDRAEDTPEKVFKVNVHGTFNLRSAYQGRIIFLSTDYIFDGKHGPYAETAKPSALGWYGLSKASAENFLDRTDVVIRTTALYGNLAFDDFAQKIVRKATEGKTFQATKSLYGNPTYIPHLAEAILWMAALMTSGSYPNVMNIAGQEVISRYEFARMILAEFGLDRSLCLPTRDVPGKAKRPKHGGLKLDQAKKWGVPLYSVKEGIREFKKGYERREQNQ